MRLTKAASALAIVAALSTPDIVCAQQQPLPWKDGPVMSVSFIRTKPGKFNDYMRYIMGPYKQLLDAQKQAGIILDWSVATATPQDPTDSDIILYTTYANMAALDNLADRTEPIMQRVFGSMQQRDQSAIDREVLRTQMGGRLIRVVVPR